MLEFLNQPTSIAYWQALVLLVLLAVGICATFRICIQQGKLLNRIKKHPCDVPMSGEEAYRRKWGKLYLPETTPEPWDELPRYQQMYWERQAREGKVRPK